MGYRVNASNSMGTVGSRGVIADAKEALELAESYIAQGMKNVTLVDEASGQILNADQIEKRLAVARRSSV